MGASNLFVITQALLFFGTLSVRANVSADTYFRWIAIQLVGIVSFLVGAAAANVFTHTNPRLAHESFLRRKLVFDMHSSTYWALMVLGVISAVVGIVFSVRFGQHALIKTLRLYAQNSASTAIAYSMLRKSAVYGDVYFGYGYVMQFTDFLLPCFSCLLLFRANCRGKMYDRLALFLFMCVTLWCLTVTGRREPTLRYALCLCLVISTRYGVGLGSVLNRYWRKRIVAILVGAGIFFLLTNAVRYSTSVSIGYGLVQLWNRLGATLAEEKLRIMEFIFQQPTVCGQQWVDSLLTIVPGSHKPALSNQMHMMLYGSTGNAPLEFWGSTWYNFGWIGIMVLPFLVGIFLQWVTLSTLTGPKTATRSVLLMMLSIQLASAIEPYHLLNNGIFALWIVLIVTKFTRCFDNRILTERRRGVSCHAETCLPH